MAPSPDDISWQVLRRILQDWAGNAAELAEVAPLSGGCINTTLGLTTKDGLKAVLKICAHRVSTAFAHEAFQLEILRSAGVPVPKVYTWKVGSLDDPFSYILMEHIDGVNFHQAKALLTADEFDHLQIELAELIAALHNHIGEGYGRVRSDAPRHEDWPQFFREVYDPILTEMEKSVQLPVKVRKQLHKIHDRLEHLVGHGDKPRLVHWDLWSTNLMAHKNGDGRWHVAAILDPNCKYAHSEAELAYMELFHTVTPAFLKAYTAHHKLTPEYHRIRKSVYQLYSLVNHANVFGQEYLKPLIGAVEKLHAAV